MGQGIDDHGDAMHPCLYLVSRFAMSRDTHTADK